MRLLVVVFMIRGVSIMRGGGDVTGEAGGEEEGRVASCHRECTWNVVGVLWVVRV